MSVIEDRRWQRTQYLVQATHTEKFLLWAAHSTDSLHLTPDNTIDWEDDCGGLWGQIGELDGRPVSVAFWWATLDGVLVCFYEPTSQVVDWEMIDNWITQNFRSRWTESRHCDAMNFCHCLHFVADQQVKPDVIVGNK